MDSYAVCFYISIKAQSRCNNVQNSTFITINPRGTYSFDRLKGIISMFVHNISHHNVKYMICLIISDFGEIRYGDNKYCESTHKILFVALCSEYKLKCYCT